MSYSTASGPSEDLHPVDAWMAENGEEFLDHMNGDFGDALLMVGRALTDRTDASTVVLTGLDPSGVDAIATDGEGDHQVRIEFDRTLEHSEDITMALLDLVTKAREVAGDAAEQTSGDREVEALSLLTTYLTEVVAVSEVHPHLRQVTFGGGDLVNFESAGPDTFLYLLLPPPGRTELGIDQSFTWEAHARMPDEDKPVGNYYTVRRWRPEAAEIDVLMVLHDDHGDSDTGGHASRWAARAQVGDKVALWGPRTAYDPPAGTEHWVLVADETGLPAVAVIIEQLPEGATAHVLAEVADAAEHQELPERDGVTVTWLHRDGAAPGTTSLLADAARELPTFDRPTYVWGGGESRAMTAVRRHVRDERGLGRGDVSLVAYWRHSTTTDADVDA